mmetsp:Transcript_25685/g.58249  ORF Transcript_25685/g.58249 Transcript_25685/m.58249 type:complete len:312 (-) Transcript_25685:82-1017(-)
MTCRLCARLGACLLVWAATTTCRLGFVLPWCTGKWSGRGPRRVGGSKLPRYAQEGVSPPSSARAMVDQAAQSVMAAFQDGISRQSVRLRLDMVCPPERVTESGLEALLSAGLPMAKAFTMGLQAPDGAPLSDVRISRFDGVGTTSGDVGTLLYRVTEDAKQDAAVVFLGGRKFVLQDPSGDFIKGMKDRLVVMLNAEDAATSFRIENKGSEMSQGGNFGKDVETLAKFCEDFQEETYYIRLLLLSDWPVILFRAYPNRWMVFMESLDGDVVRLLESSRKPVAEDIAEEIRKYEEENGISAADKMAKAQGQR